MTDPMSAWCTPVSVLVVGDIMLDRYTFGTVDRVSPEAPVPVVVEASESVTPGGAGNAARGVAALGEKVAIVGVVGADAAGNQVRESLAMAGVDTAAVLVVEGPTAVKHRVIAAGQQIVRIDTEPRGRTDATATGELLDLFFNRLDTTDIVFMSDYAKGVCVRALCQEVIRAAARADKPVVVDPKSADFTAYEGATLITPNLAEARRAVAVPDCSPGEMGRRLVDGTGASILLTQGPEGMTLFQPDANATHFPARGLHVYDVTGAGDTVAATVAAGLGHGIELEDACWLANEAAAIAVSRRGTAAVTKAELRAAVLAAK